MSLGVLQRLRVEAASGCCELSAVIMGTVSEGWREWELWHDSGLYGSILHVSWVDSNDCRLSLTTIVQFLVWKKQQ